MAGIESLFAFLVQSRMSGVQGQNGCWIDEGIVEAASPEEAIEKVASDRLVSTYGPLPEREHRVGRLPEWESFWPKVHTEHVKSVVVNRA